MLMLISSCTVGASQALAADSMSLGYRVKAAFLFNFALYTQWPATAQATAAKPFEFCVAGSDTMLLAVQEAVADKSLGGQTPRVYQVSGDDDLSHCQLLYVADGVDAEFARHLNDQGGASILIVGEGRAFPQDFGMVGFHLLEDRLRFAINPVHIQKSGLQMSSRLLGLADIVASEPD